MIPPAIYNRLLSYSAKIPLLYSEYTFSRHENEVEGYKDVNSNKEEI